MATRLFKRYEVSEGKEISKAIERGRSRTFAKFGTVLIVLAFLLSLLPGGEAGAQATWQVVTIPILPAGAVLTGVWSSGPNDVYVSAYMPTDVPQGFVFRWDGTSWSQVLSPPLSLGHSMGKVFGTGPSDVYAVAYRCTAGQAAGCGADRGGRIFRSTDGGANWTPQVLPPEVGVNGLGDISGTPGNVHVNGHTYIIRFDGSGWNTVFTSPSVYANVYTLTVLSPNEGYYTTCWGWGRWNGASWTFNGIQFDFCDVNSVWGIRDGVGALHLYTAGNNNFSNGVRVWKFNEVTPPVCVPPGSPCSFGSKFGYVFSDGSGANAGSAAGIWGSGPNDIYVIGNLPNQPGPSNGRIYHFDGTPWQQVTVIGPIPNVNSIWGTGPQDVWVTLSNGQLLHYAPPPNTPPTVDAGGPYSGDEGAPIGLNGTASDPDNDPLTVSWSYAAGVGVDAGATCTFANASALSTTITCTDDGAYTVTLTVDDGTNPPVSSSADVTVSNVPPDLTITSPSAGALYAVNTTVNLSGSFSDQGANDTHPCMIDWDDGAAPQAGTVSEVGGSGTCAGSKTFALAGVYNIQVTVSDDDGGSDTESVMIVVYDPSAGFVTGGGWIDSPPGAYTPEDPTDPDITGRANFGFVSKYQKGATTPTGQTEFQFQAGNLNFHSSNYQWLVVAGAKAQYKGTGTINGVSGYGFLLTATDGQISGGVDKFRIKIWDTTSDTVIYDNVPGASEDIDAATPQPIANGSIVIHKGK